MQSLEFTSCRVVGGPLLAFCTKCEGSFERMANSNRVSQRRSPHLRSLYSRPRGGKYGFRRLISRPSPAGIQFFFLRLARKNENLLRIWGQWCVYLPCHTRSGVITSGELYKMGEDVIYISPLFSFYKDTQSEGGARNKRLVIRWAGREISFFIFFI